MLLGCGTVIASENGKSKVRFARNYCDGCPGSCRLISNRDVELWLDEKLSIGDDVEVETSPASLTLGTAIALGFPLFFALAVFYFFESWSLALLALVLAAIAAIAYCRSSQFSAMLRPRVRVLG
ncbi:MAG: SoxR reducing system RseC family protein [Gammaproteobacteria bacterium]|nr:SoxR reducing system RseC family protein [Gammaproteobacteria bacterium]